MTAALTTRIPIKNEHGQVIDEKEVATYAGLLSRAHGEGLKRIETDLVQVPTPDNGGIAIVRAIVETDKGTFTGIGDASTGNVNRRIAPHLIRMAETRAKARALRDATNIGVVALEELGGEDESDVPAPVPPVRNVRPLRSPEPLPDRSRSGSPPSARGDSRSGSGSDGSARMSEAQAKLLFRILAENGYEGQDAKEKLCEEAGVASLAQVTKQVASTLIDAWSRRQARG